VAREISQPRPIVTPTIGYVTTSESLQRLWFILPAVVLILFLSIFPLLMSLGLVFSEWNWSALNTGIRFNGLENWVRLACDERFWNAVKNTVRFIVVGVPLQYGLGLGLALLLNGEVWGRKFFRVCFLLPMALTPVAVGFLVGRMLFNPNIGPVNQWMMALGLPPLGWTTDPRIAWFVIVLVDTWQWTPFMFLILHAGLQSLPLEIYEASRIDGASEWQMFRHLTFPLLLPVSTTGVLLRALEMFKLIDIVVVVTGGGPGTSTETVTYYAYQVGGRNFDLGYASAVAYALLIMTVVFALLYVRWTRRAVARVV
jgi:multiple sugar transport system permease protein